MGAWRIGEGQQEGLAERVPEGYRIDLFAEQDEIGPDEIVALWLAEGNLTEAEARKRLDEVLLVASAPGGGLAAISTAYMDRDPILHVDLWHYRTLVAAAHRQANLAATMAVIGRDHLEHRFTSGSDTRAAGILSEVHSPALKSLNLAVWRQTGFAFIGEDDRGSHIRIHWFRGAHAPLPPNAA